MLAASFILSGVSIVCSAGNIWWAVRQYRRLPKRPTLYLPDPLSGPNSSRFTERLTHEMTRPLCEAENGGRGCILALGHTGHHMSIRTDYTGSGRTMTGRLDPTRRVHEGRLPDPVDPHRPIGETADERTA